VKPRRYRCLTFAGLATVILLLLNMEPTVSAVGSPEERTQIGPAGGDLVPLGELAKSIIDTPMAVMIPPPKGKAKHSIDKGHRTYAVATGETRFMLAKLPKFATPYVFTIKSMCNCLGFSKSLFVPRGAFLNEQFQQTREVDETEFTAVTRGGWQLDLEVEIGLDRKDDAYLLLYTDGSRVGQRLGKFRDSTNGLVPAAIGWPVSRSEHGTISFETTLPKK